MVIFEEFVFVLVVSIIVFSVLISKRFGLCMDLLGDISVIVFLMCLIKLFIRVFGLIKFGFWLGILIFGV